MPLFHAWKGQLLFVCHYIAKPPCEQHPSKSYTEPKPVIKIGTKTVTIQQNIDQPFVKRGREEKGQLLRFFAITLQSRLF